MLSDPLKKLHSKYLTEVVKNCYPEKHMQEDWTNLEQIQICRDTQKDKVMGAFLQSMHVHRDSDFFKNKDCVNGVDNDMYAAIACYKTYLSDIKNTNEVIAAEFQQNYL